MRRLGSILTALMILGSCGVDEPASAPDAADTAEDVVPDAPPPEPAVIIGTNVPLANYPDSFQEVPDGGTLEIELGGFNGLWMTVLAFKTRGFFDQRIIVFAEVTIDGEIFTELKLSKQDLIEGGDGWDYYYDLFMLVNDTAGGGKAAQIRLTVMDYEDKDPTVEVTTQVTLVGGDPPWWPPDP